jgi:hypothetical protein
MNLFFSRQLYSYNVSYKCYLVYVINKLFILFRTTQRPMPVAGPHVGYEVFQEERAVRLVVAPVVHFTASEINIIFL